MERYLGSYNKVYMGAQKLGGVQARNSGCKRGVPKSPTKIVAMDEA